MFDQSPSAAGSRPARYVVVSTYMLVPHCGQAATSAGASADHQHGHMGHGKSRFLRADSTTLTAHQAGKAVLGAHKANLLQREVVHLRALVRYDMMCTSTVCYELHQQS